MVIDNSCHYCFHDLDSKMWLNLSCGYLSYFSGVGRTLCPLSNERQERHLRIYTSPSARDSSHKSTGIRVTFCHLFVITSDQQIGWEKHNSHSILVVETSNFAALTNQRVLGSLFALVCLLFHLLTRNILWAGGTIHISINIEDYNSSNWLANQSVAGFSNWLWFWDQFNWDLSIKVIKKIKINGLVMNS